MVRVEVPADTKAGLYIGTVSVQGGDGEVMEVRVEVVETSPVPHDSW
jgi:hypothetical protein